MALYAKVGSFAQPSSTGNQVISGLGFKPKMVLFIGSHLTADGGASDVCFSFGVGVSSTDRRCTGGTSDDAAAVSVCGRIWKYTKCVCFGNIGTPGTAVAEADFVSQDEDGFTINWTTADATARTVMYLAIGGDDLSNVKGGTDEALTTLGQDAVVGVGFQPDLLLFFNVGFQGGSDTTGAGSNRPSLSAAISSTSRAACGQHAQDAVTTSSTGRYQRTVLAIVAMTENNSSAEADLVSMDSDGFTVNWSKVSATSSHDYMFTALKGAQVKIGTITNPSATGNQATTGVGFKPKAIILLSFGNVASSAVQNDFNWSMGIGAGPTERGCLWNGEDDAQATTTADSDLERTRILQSFTAGTTPSKTTDADLVSLDDDGFTLNWLTADATARQIIYVAIGPSANPVDDLLLNKAPEENSLIRVNRVAEHLVGA